MILDMALSGYSLGICGAPPLPLQHVRPRLTVKRIQEVTADYYNISSIHMTGASREASHAHPRQLAMFLCREMLGRSTPDIGRRFGDRDHTTVLHALKAVRKRLTRNEDLADDIVILKRRARSFEEALA